MLTCKIIVSIEFANILYVLFINSTTGLNLIEELKCQLIELSLDLKDCRVQAYNNGASMIGHIKEYNFELFQKIQNFFLFHVQFVAKIYFLGI